MGMFVNSKLSFSVFTYDAINHQELCLAFSFGMSSKKKQQNNKKTKAAAADLICLCAVFAAHSLRVCSFRSQCAMAALNDVRHYLLVEGGQVAVSSLQQIFIICVCLCVCIYIDG